MTSPNPGVYNTAATPVGNSATLIATVATGTGGLLVQNTGAVAVYLGGPGVTSSGANIGVSLAANTTITVPSVGGPACQLYAITASSTATVVVLFPSGA